MKPLAAALRDMHVHGTAPFVHPVSNLQEKLWRHHVQCLRAIHASDQVLALEGIEEAFGPLVCRLAARRIEFVEVGGSQARAICADLVDGLGGDNAYAKRQVDVFDKTSDIRSILGEGGRSRSQPFGDGQLRADKRSSAST